jgi:hypothetical protein
VLESFQGGHGKVHKSLEFHAVCHLLFHLCRVYFVFCASGPNAAPACTSSSSQAPSKTEEGLLAEFHKCLNSDSQLVASVSKVNGDIHRVDQDVIKVIQDLVKVNHDLAKANQFAVETMAKIIDADEQTFDSMRYVI